MKKLNELSNDCFVRDPAITKAEMLQVMANVRKPGCARSI